MKRVYFTVPGKPQGKARARTFYNAAVGKHVSTTPDNTVLYENLIKDRYLQQAGGIYLERGIPVSIRIVIKFLPPKSTSKIKHAEMLCGALKPLKKPDMDNIVKVVADALNGVAYHDDTQIVSVSAKKYMRPQKGSMSLWRNITDKERRCRSIGKTEKERPVLLSFGYRFF